MSRAAVDAIHNVDRSLPVTEIGAVERAVAEPMAEQRMVMALMIAFAALALVLSTLGIYSVLSYSITQRTREIGLRVALGAHEGNVLRLVIGDGLRMAVIGITLGIAGALALTRLMTDLLYGVHPTDLVTFSGVTIVLAMVSLSACYVPARRAMKIDPIVALRYE
jgi:putative ABC transport system permease protein